MNFVDAIFPMLIVAMIGVAEITLDHHTTKEKPMPKHKTLYEIIIEPLQREAIKHDKLGCYPQQYVDKMTNEHFLQTISDALEERLAQEKTK